jgi:hypothetical protein
MNPESKSSAPVKPQFGGSIELIPPAPTMIEFIGKDGLWGFPIGQLNHFVLGRNPEHKEKSTIPPDQLRLFYPTAVVVLRGWRLELMIGALISGRVARVHAEKMLGSLMIEQPWVSEIQVEPLIKVDPAEVPIAILSPSKGRHEPR